MKNTRFNVKISMSKFTHFNVKIQPKRFNRFQEVGNKLKNQKLESYFQNCSAKRIELLDV